MSKLEIAVLIGAESKEFLADLTKQIDRLEKLSGKKATTAAETEDVADKPAKTAAAKANGKKAAAVEEEEFDLGADEAAEDEAPAVTKKDLIAACRDNREAAIKVLKKLKVSSVHELKPAQYSKVLAEIGA